ncbi:hypothetical protein B0H10DRAFT_2194529 [Mycena sp. CBHHK59/15]|nr:hypothetical protein B0H10DRAFT_2194529 [Mycena sp. CBHHK59/15]
MAGRGQHSPIPSESSSGLSESSELAAQTSAGSEPIGNGPPSASSSIPFFHCSRWRTSLGHRERSRSSSNVFLPRVMARLLHVLAYNPKVSLHNWQAALRKQHNRRDPASNPIGPEPGPDDNPAPAPTDDTIMEANGRGSEKSVPEKVASAPPGQNYGSCCTAGECTPRRAEGLAWPPDAHKLDSIHLMTKWHFQNPKRLRSLKSDDEGVTWRIGPIGYDAKSNAYWLIGVDRLWIERVQRKPRFIATTSSLKRNRTIPHASEFERPRVKRARLASQGPSKLTVALAPIGGRASRAHMTEPREPGLVAGSGGDTKEHGELRDWETICVTLSDWKHMAEQFENSTHYAEKALRKVLVRQVKLLSMPHIPKNIRNEA